MSKMTPNDTVLAVLADTKNTKKGDKQPILKPAELQALTGLEKNILVKAVGELVQSGEIVFSDNTARLADFEPEEEAGFGMDFGDDETKDEEVKEAPKKQSKKQVPVEKEAPAENLLYMVNTRASEDDEYDCQFAEKDYNEALKEYNRIVKKNADADVTLTSALIEGEGDEGVQIDESSEKTLFDNLNEIEAGDEPESDPEPEAEPEEVPAPVKSSKKGKETATATKTKSKVRHEPLSEMDGDALGARIEESVKAIALLQEHKLDLAAEMLMRATGKAKALLASLEA